MAVDAQANGSAIEAAALFRSLGDYKDSKEHTNLIQSAVTAFRAELARIAAERVELENATAAANESIAIGLIPLDGKTLTALKKTISDSASPAFEAPAMPESLADIQSSCEGLKSISYSDATQLIIHATKAYEDSATQYGYVNAPAEEFVIDRLMRVPEIAFIAAATEANDPNDQLGKPGGYTSQVFFSSTLVSSAYAQMPDFDVLEAGTLCGGSVETYATVEAANNRNAYLASFDGSVFSTGSHTVVGTVVVRTSSDLTASQQKALENAIIDSLTSLNPGPVIERQAVAAPSENGAGDSVDNHEQGLVTVKEAGFFVNNGWLHYALIAHNNLKDTAILYPQFRIVTRNAAGGLLSVDTQVLSIMYPDQDVVYASLGGEVGEAPAAIEIELVQPESYNLVKPGNLEHPTFIPLNVMNAALQKGRYFNSLICEIYNPNDYSISTAAVTIVYRDENGKLLGGETSFCDAIEAGATVPFSIRVDSEFDGLSYEVTAMPW